jgi:hypothetical protein
LIVFQPTEIVNVFLFYFPIFSKTFYLNKIGPTFNPKLSNINHIMIDYHYRYNTFLLGYEITRKEVKGFYVVINLIESKENLSKKLNF